MTASAGVHDALSDVPSYASPAQAGADAFAPQRANGRFARAKIQIAAGGAWSHATGYEARYWPEGTR